MESCEFYVIKVNILNNLMVSRWYFYGSVFFRIKKRKRSSFLQARKNHKAK